jgi:hypothetical protein
MMPNTIDWRSIQRHQEETQRFLATAQPQIEAAHRDLEAMRPHVEPMLR